MTRDEVLGLLRERIFAFAASRMGRDAAEDLAQDTLMVIEQRYAGVSDLAELVPLGFQIVRFKMAGRQRKIVRRGEHIAARVDGLPLADPGLDPEMQAQREELTHRLIEALQSMGERCRTIFRMKLDGHGFDEIRRHFGVSSINTIYTWDLRCRQELKLLLNIGAARENA